MYLPASQLVVGALKFLFSFYPGKVEASVTVAVVDSQNLRTSKKVTLRSIAAHSRPPLSALAPSTWMDVVTKNFHEPSEIKSHVRRGNESHNE